MLRVMCSGGTLFGTSVWSRRMSARTCIASVALALAGLLGGACVATADDFYKGKTVQLIIGTGEGGGYDLSARLVAQFLPDYIPGRPVVVPRNMPGAGSIAAAEYVYNVAPKDGTVVLIVQPTFLLEKINDRSRKYEPEKFSWLGRVDQSVVMGVIGAKSPAQSVAEAKTRTVVIAANAAAGTSATIPWALNKMIGTRYKVVLGYDSSANMGFAIEKGEADALGSTSWDYLETKRDWFEGPNKVKIPYVITLQRFKKLPDVPTVAATLPGFDAEAWFALAAPGATPAPLLTQVNAAVRAALATPGVQARFAEAGATAGTQDVAGVTRFVAAERTKWAQVVRASGAKAE
jgi:tripartite-type tricarboxylate transporter receptor subunit TctC